MTRKQTRAISSYKKEYVPKRLEIHVSPVIQILLGAGIMAGIVWALNWKQPKPVVQQVTSVPAVTIVIYTATPMPTATATLKPRTVSNEGRNFIMLFEGNSLVAYYDITGHCTIGMGHRIESIWCDGQLKTSDEQTKQWFAEDIRSTEVFLGTEMGGVELNQCQFDALADFAFNLGPYYFEVSGIREALTQKDTILFLKILSRYAYSEGVYLKNLADRRASEAKLFTECDYGN
jgi:lysozyme